MKFKVKHHHHRANSEIILYLKNWVLIGHQGQRSIACQYLSWMFCHRYFTHEAAFFVINQPYGTKCDIHLQDQGYNAGTLIIMHIPQYVSRVSILMTTNKSTMENRI